MKPNQVQSASQVANKKPESFLCLGLNGTMPRKCLEGFVWFSEPPTGALRPTVQSTACR